MYSDLEPVQANFSLADYKLDDKRVSVLPENLEEPLFFDMTRFLLYFSDLQAVVHENR